MPLRSMADTSLQLTRMEVELSAVAVTLVGGLEGAGREGIIIIIRLLVSMLTISSPSNLYKYNKYNVQDKWIISEYGKHLTFI